MAHGQDYSGGQRKIIDRYYEHKDTIATQKLGEIVSDLYLNTDARKADQLWDRAAKALANITVNRAQVDKVLSERKVEPLAQLINELALNAKAAQKSPDARPPTPPAAASSPPAPVSLTPPAPAAAPATFGGYSHEELKTALKAFKKRVGSSSRSSTRSPSSAAARSPAGMARGSSRFNRPINIHPVSGRNW